MSGAAFHPKAVIVQGAVFLAVCWQRDVRQSIGCQQSSPTRASDAPRRGRRAVNVERPPDLEEDEQC